MLKDVLLQILKIETIGNTEESIGDHIPIKDRKAYMKKRKEEFLNEQGKNKC